MRNYKAYKEHDEDDLMMGILLCAIVGTILCFAVPAFYLVGYLVTAGALGVFLVAILLYVAWVIKYFTINQHIIYLTGELERKFDQCATRYDLNEVERQVMNEIDADRRKQKTNDVLVDKQVYALETLRDQFNAVNKHYGIQCTHQESGFIVEEIQD